MPVKSCLGTWTFSNFTGCFLGYSKKFNNIKIGLNHVSGPLSVHLKGALPEISVRDGGMYFVACLVKNWMKIYYLNV